ncbi:MAG TPA: hypothetical protein ENG70_01125 [Candidatus Cloacimonetes bacterium]|nr:hypothetical protein [Candidatus Cloacimonadota bacterium]HEX37453.1 hypothetical protein [Candidatus Cloacimonadota bacterium]
MEILMHRVGIWIGAFLTFAIFSFLYKDNPFYKIAEQIFIGISAGYWFIYTIYNILIPNLFTPLSTGFSQNWILLIPAFLGVLMLCRLIPSIDWVSRYALALVVGTTAGLFFKRYLQSDVLNQLNATMLNPFASGNIAQLIGELILIVGTITGIVYFFFSKKHEGAFGVTARVGIYFLMISFGAAFGYTVMARISLLIGRLNFLLGDWLGIIKP